MIHDDLENGKSNPPAVHETEYDGMTEYADVMQECVNDPTTAIIDDPAPPPRKLEPIIASDDPHRLAGIYLTQHEYDGLYTLRRHQGEYVRWNGDAYHAVPDDEIEAEATTAAHAEMIRCNIAAQEMGSYDDDKGPPPARKVTGRMVSDVMGAIKSMTILPSSIQSPAWICGDAPYPASECVAFPNGVVHLPTYADGGRDYLVEPTPRYYTTTCVPFPFAPNAPDPVVWLDFLNRVWPGDQESIDLLREWYGYCLLPDTTHHKILGLFGPARGGKGTIIRILFALLGRSNVVTPTLASLSADFGIQPLLGKSLAVISDARLSTRSDLATIAERLLSISGDDEQTIPRKFLPAWIGHLDSARRKKGVFKFATGSMAFN